MSKCVRYVIILLPAASCASNQFKCRSGECILGNSQCDGVNDCSDNSDELGCSKSLFRKDAYGVLTHTRVYTCTNVLRYAT